MGSSEPKWVNPNDISYGVNSLRLGGLQIKCMDDQIGYTVWWELGYKDMANRHAVVQMPTVYVILKKTNDNQAIRLH